MSFSIGIPPSADLLALLLGEFLAGFIAGAIPFGYLAGRLQGLDIRRHGSGNIGFTNVARVIGWQYALPVLVLDAAKGFLPVLLSSALARAIGGSSPAVLAALGSSGTAHGVFSVLAGAGAIAGHLFSPFLRFRGGKGVATTAGVFLALTPLAVALCVAVFLVVLLVSRYVSLASVLTAIALPLAAGLVPPRSGPTLALALIACIVIVLRHASNIRRLLAGTESRFRFRRVTSPERT